MDCAKQQKSVGNVINQLQRNQQAKQTYTQPRTKHRTHIDGDYYDYFNVIIISSISRKIQIKRLSKLIKMMLRSPPVKFNVIFCVECNDQINNASSVKCDNCEKMFHENCSVQTKKEVLSDIIYLCNKCSNDNNICSQKDTIQIKSSTSPQNTKRLRLLTSSGDEKKKFTFSKGDLEKLNIKRQIRHEKKHEKIKYLENKINQIESSVCPCSNLYEKRIATIEKIIIELQTPNRNKVIRDDAIETGDDEIETGKDEIVLSNEEIVNKRLTKNEKAIVDVAIFERSNCDWLASIDLNICKFERRLQEINKVTDSLNALQETHTTAIFELQKSMIGHNTHIDDYEALMQLNGGHKNVMNNLDGKNSMESASGINGDFKHLSTVIDDFAVALRKHNNTLKTHFKLNDAYNEETLRKIETKLNLNNQLQNKVTNRNTRKPNRSNRNNNKQQKLKETISNNKQQSNNNKQQKLKETMNKFSSPFGTITFKPIPNHTETSDKVKIYLNDIVAGLSVEEIQHRLTEIFERYADALMNGVTKWHINKITFNTDHSLSRAILIAMFPGPVNVLDLSTHVSNFFGN